MGRVVEDEALSGEVLAPVRDRARRQGAYGGGIDGDSAGLGGRIHLLAMGGQLKLFPRAWSNTYPAWSWSVSKFLLSDMAAVLSFAFWVLSMEAGEFARGLGDEGEHKGGLRRWDEMEGPLGSLPVPVSLRDTYMATLVSRHGGIANFHYGNVFCWPPLPPHLQVVTRCIGQGEWGEFRARHRRRSHHRRAGPTGEASRARKGATNTTGIGGGEARQGAEEAIFVPWYMVRWHCIGSPPTPVHGWVRALPLPAANAQ
jgi:hypothetical protein